ncbi:MAG: hypothetical protein LUM44_12655 [Pyrinomonadaceae bacterium]|nr:hypothetical protein [Pyrinomonadaceae bacterium]
MDISHCQQIYETELKENPPLPPWLAYPDVDKLDMFWRMGRGEEHIELLGIYFHFCGEEDLEKYKLNYPEVEDWKGWYDE